MPNTYTRKRQRLIATVKVTCSRCGAEGEAKAKGSSQAAALPKGWRSRTKGLFSETICPDCQKGC